MKRVVFNGKFYAGALNGVHRVADRLVRKVDVPAAKHMPCIGAASRASAVRPVFETVRGVPGRRRSAGVDFAMALP